MIQLMTFLIAQLMFVPVYLKVTDTCTENKGTFWQKIKIISISPFAVYLYVNIFFAFVMAFIPAPIAENLVMSADVFVISLSFIFVNLYAGICCKIASWDKIYYASIYLSFFLLQMAFNYTYVTAAGSVVCNILVPLIVIWYYIRKLMPLYISIKKKPEVKVSRSLFLLPAMAELFFVYRSFVIIAISAKYPEVALNDIYANAILTGFSYILTGFVFVCMTTLLKNILDEQDIKCETEKNKELTTDMIKALVKTIDAKDPYTNGHSIRVAEYTRMLAEQAYTDSDELHNIYNIALLHDIGRFEQLKRFNSFEADTMDHATYGVKVLFEEGMIRQFIEEDTWDDVIRTAIAKHSDYELTGITDERTLLHARLIRDADKLDNCRVKLEDAMETLLDLSADEVGKYAISPKVREDAFAGKCICSKDRRTPMDYWVSYVAYFYDLNFQETLDIVAEEQYVKRIIGRVPYTNEQTKKTMEELERQLTEYVRRK